MLIKLFSLYLLISALFSVIPTYISHLYYETDLVTLLKTFGAAAILGGLIVVLLFNTDYLISKLKLDQGFDDKRIDLSNISSQDLLKLGVFIIGGLLLLDYVPSFINHAYWALKFDIDKTTSPYEMKFQMGLSAINIIIGYVFVTNYDRMAKIFSNSSNKQT